MVRFSPRQQVLRELRQAFIPLVLLSSDPLSDPDVESLIYLYELAQADRYLQRQRDAADRRIAHWLATCTRHLAEPPQDFRKLLRVSRSQFIAIFSKIKDDPVFQSKGEKPQAPPVFQFMVALYRFTHNGNAASAYNVGRLFSCAGMST